MNWKDSPNYNAQLSERMTKEKIVLDHAKNLDALQLHDKHRVTPAMAKDIAELATAILDCHLEELAIDALTQTLIELAERTPAELTPAEAMDEIEALKRGIELSPAEVFTPQPPAKFWRTATDADAGSWPR